MGVDREPDPDPDHPARAIIVDYKGARRQSPQARWLDERVLQAGLYALALRAAEPGTEIAGALYQPLGADPDNAGARGFLLEGVDAGRTDIAAEDRVDAMRREELLGEVLERARQIAAAIRRGEITPQPGTCGWRGGGCEHPAICRCGT